MKNINEIVRAILNKRKPKVVAIIKPEPKPKPLAKVIPAQKPKPRPKAVVDQEAIDIMNLANTDPLKAFRMAKAKDARVKKERLEKARFMALSPLEKEREEERINLIKKAALTLAANLPKASELGLDPNWRGSILLTKIAEAAFRSSLENNVLWISNGLGDLSVKVGAQTVEVHSQKDLLESAAKKLFNWSGMGKSLNNDKGEEPNVWDLIRGLGKAAMQYKAQQAKLKSSEYYLSQLVKNSIGAPLKYTKETATRVDILTALALATAEVGVSLGFFKDAQKIVNIDCSDNRYGTTQLTDKVMLPYMRSIIDSSKVAGRLTSDKDAANLLSAFINFLSK